ncbi:hypothetical protein [Paenibacillus illinoisensis]|uniref:Uncharacterized protein n=1 Tax=Paenibacillus illinoisensis TaxID=59845 RepID=A0A2W0CI89_9BACL|nr:hypothetical protein [Paenibacillus illinoisensis]PYY29772.1 hypothetical protein PIL02S_01972 [Paenibacillus illinoisensis]
MGYNNGYDNNNYAITSILRQIGLGTTITVHFQGENHSGTFAGINNGVLVLNRTATGQTSFFPVNQISGIDVP